MKWFGNLLPYALATAGIILASTLTNKVTGTSPASSHAYPLTTSTSNQTDTATTSPRRLTVTVKVAEPTDLKIAEGQTIREGQIISDRISEKTRLTSQQKQLQLSLDRLKGATTDGVTSNLKSSHSKEQSR
ncbi:hypothetical protein Sta7437_4894 (plasmid) [Stanieria cyanosphaera PCC 7437]|uniref:Uncharacterized protein n=1 Tax=Stanieria cyanosphaera (strain ATCC 29371 / PCC 7437) TaxID=111780 RepID=K9Y2R4_STAC7|nr:hypothetical protein [Stanieria cyanosphaera]AFZ38322.1 hypothetical protein Sta7437_4894 [Stanieria cyanosphaera PCC 7437]